MCAFCCKRFCCAHQATHDLLECPPTIFQVFYFTYVQLCVLWPSSPLLPLSLCCVPGRCTFTGRVHIRCADHSCSATHGRWNVVAGSPSGIEVEAILGARCSDRGGIQDCCSKCHHEHAHVVWGVEEELDAQQSLVPPIVLVLPSMRPQKPAGCRAGKEAWG